MSTAITIHPPVLRELQSAARLVSVLDFDGRSVDMWYEVPKEYAHWFSTDRVDGFVVGIILQSMEAGKDIVTLAPMSSKLYHNLTGFYIPLMASVFPNLKPIDLRPAALIGTVGGGHGVATGFSGGIDSFATVCQHFANEISEDHKVSHFLFHNAGSHSDGDHDNARKLFRQRYEVLRPFAEEAGIPFVAVDSNLSEVFPIDFVRMHHALNASVLLALQGGFHRYFYASTYKYADCIHGMSDDISRYDPVAFHLFSTEGLDCVSTGCQLSRIDKTQLVAGYEPSRRHLNVCVDPEYKGRNCSVCFKCCRTILTLELINKVDLYNKAFDLKRFHTVRAKYIRNSVMKTYSGSFESEIVELAREVCDEPWARSLRRRQVLKNAMSRVGAVVQTAGKLPRRIAKSVLRR